ASGGAHCELSVLADESAPLLPNGSGLVRPQLSEIRTSLNFDVAVFPCSKGYMPAQSPLRSSSASARGSLPRTALKDSMGSRDEPRERSSERSVSPASLFNPPSPFFAASEPNHCSMSATRTSAHMYE